jgi:hypothetical protein
MKRITLFIVLLALSYACSVVPLVQAQLPGHSTQADPTPASDAYEVDDVNPAWIGDGESQNRNFYPTGDVDKVRFAVKAGQWYEVQTYGLGPLVDTSLSVEAGGLLYKDDDGGPERLASRVLFQAPETGEALVTVINRQEVYGGEQVYKLYAGETAAPTPTPTNTPKPTSPPPPTATPGKPVISFSATPDHVDRPGACATLRWSVERASEVFLVFPNGNQEGVEGLGERQVCPETTSQYQLKVNAPAGDETAQVQIAVPLPTHTPTPAATDAAKATSGGSNSPKRGSKAPLHVVVYVDENRSDAYDPYEGVQGAVVRLVSQADPGQVQTAITDSLGQVHFAKVAAEGYVLQVPHLSYAETLLFRGEELTLYVAFPGLKLPSRIP